MKIAVDFFQLELVNHLLEAGLCCKMFAYLSRLSFNELLWSLSYFSHPGSVKCPPCCGSIEIPCLFPLQLFGIVPGSECVLQDVAWEISPKAFNANWGVWIHFVLWCHLLWARMTLYQVTWIRKEGNESLAVPTSQLNRCAGSWDVSAMSSWSFRGINVVCIGAGRVRNIQMVALLGFICTCWGALLLPPGA